MKIGEMPNITEAISREDTEEILSEADRKDGSTKYSLSEGIHQGADRERRWQTGSAGGSAGEWAEVRGGTFFEKVRKWMGNHGNQSVME